MNTTRPVPFPATAATKRFVHSGPETPTTASASSARSLAFFFAFFRLLRSLSRCFALCISLFDRPGLLMSSSYTTLHYYFARQARMGLPDLVQQDASCDLSILLQRARFLARYTDSRGFMQQLDIILRLVNRLPPRAAACTAY